MIYKYVSVFQIIEKIYRDYPHKQELDVWDVVEWAGEALDLIGAYTQYQRIPNKVLTVADYKVKLPCELVTIDGVKHNGAPMLYASGVHGPISSEEGTTTDNTLNTVEVDTDNFPMLGHTNNWTPIPLTYIVQNGYLHTNLRSGDIVLSYTAVQVDSNGYPMIPDDATYINAIASYIQMMLDRKEWRAQRAPEAHYRDSQMEWRRFATAARGRANSPSYDKMETMKRMWNRLRTNTQSHNSGFSSFIAPNARNR